MSSILTVFHPSLKLAREFNWFQFEQFVSLAVEVLVFLTIQNNIQGSVQVMVRFIPVSHSSNSLTPTIQYASLYCTLKG